MMCVFYTDINYDYSLAEFGKHQKICTMADDVRGWCRAVCKVFAGGGTGEQRHTSVSIKDNVLSMCLNGTPTGSVGPYLHMQSAQLP